MTVLLAISYGITGTIIGGILGGALEIAGATIAPWWLPAALGGGAGIVFAIILGGLMR